MSFKLDDIIIDQLDTAWAENFDGELLYTLTQLSEGNVEISGESKEAKDKNGTLIKKFWQGKTGTFTAKNAMLNLNVIGAASGAGKEIASGDHMINMPKIMRVKKGETPTLTDFVDGTVTVNAYAPNGTLGKSYKKNVSASPTQFAVDEGGQLTLPTDEGESLFIVKYQRKVKSGMVIRNKADKFPSTVKLTIKALAVDPCTADTLRACYIEFPSFQVSPEVSISLTTDATLDYKGDLQVDYCSADKTLYNIYWADDDIEE